MNICRNIVDLDFFLLYNSIVCASVGCRRAIDSARHKKTEKGSVVSADPER